jgi:hypothetical protein
MFTTDGRNKKCGGEGMSCTVKEAFCDERETERFQTWKGRDGDGIAQLRMIHI